MDYYHKYLKQLNYSLLNLIVTSKGKKTIPPTPDEGIFKWCDLTRELKNKEKTMFFIGNGASAMMASHMAADASKNGGFRSITFNDPASLTAISNDIAYEQSFAFPLKRFANTDDILVTISSSGNSPNIIAAIKTAKKKKLHVITLSGMKPDNKSRQLGDLNFYIPADTYGIVEVCHQALLHCWLDRYMEDF